MIQALLLAAILLPAPDVLEAARAYRRAHGAEILQEFSILLATPNVASDEPNIRRNAEQLAEALETIGLPVASTPIREREVYRHAALDGITVHEINNVAGRAASAEVRALVKELTESSGDIRFDDGQEVELKGLAGLTRVHGVEWE